MEEIHKSTQTALPLMIRNKQSTYKMIIPLEVERKIRFLCRIIPNVEWSGILFYKTSGSFDDNSLVITCLDLFQMDEGTSTYTEYKESPDIIGYVTDHPELLDTSVYQGLIHSHNNMATFFSGTDLNTLACRGNDMNHFVSLIVNNAGEYTAGVTRKVTATQAITESFSYPTWGNKIIKGERTFNKNDNEYLEWFGLDINIEKVNSNFEDEMMSRINDIRKAKTGKREVSSRTFELPLGFEEYQRPKTSLKPIDDYEDEVDENTVDWLVKQTITCSAIIAKTNNIDINKWAKSMDSLYSKRFSSMEEFESFAANFVDFLLYSIAGSFNSDLTSELAYLVKEKLSLLPKNKWLDAWIKLYDENIFY